MKIPESVRIGGIEYEVKYEPNLRLNDVLCMARLIITKALYYCQKQTEQDIRNDVVLCGTKYFTA